MLLAACAYAQNSPQELLNEATAAQQSGNLEEAVRDYRMIVAQYPNIAEIRSNLGASLAGLGHYSDAINEYKIALKLKPDPLVRLNLALAYYKAGDLEPAIEALERVHADAPQNVQAVTVLADCYLRLGRNKDVIKLLAPANADNPAFEYLLGSALVRDGQLDKGQPIIDRILKNGDSAEARFLMGVTKYMGRDFPGAREELQRAVELNPKLPELNAYYGLALLVTGDEAGAEKAFVDELKVDPNNFEANLRIGLLRRQDGAYDEALQHLNHALRIRPGDPGVRYQIATVEIAKGDTTQARRDLELLVKDQPTFLEAHVSLATMYYREKNRAAGDRERAIVAKLNAARANKNEVAVKTPQ